MGWWWLAASPIAVFLAVRLFYRITCGKYRIWDDLSGKTFLVTGANSGIGRATCRELYTHGASVVLLCRNVVLAQQFAKELEPENQGRVLVVECDLSSMQSVRQAAKEVLEKCTRIDVLVNNAGIGGIRTPSATRTPEGLELTMASNYFGHYLLTRLLLDRIKHSAPARIVNVSSFMHYFTRRFSAENLNFDLGPYDSWEGYSCSKLAQVLFTRHLADQLKRFGVTVNALNPGGVATKISRDFVPLMFSMFTSFAQAAFYIFAKTPLEGAQTTLYLSVSRRVEHISGQYFSDCVPKIPALNALDDKLAKDVWDRSAILTGFEENK